MQHPFGSSLSRTLAQQVLDKLEPTGILEVA
ncbi:hypothetical protein sphantq_01509 [Sphingobium sp. AntQ-1]|nr:hypothetical protein sphantq_01509 [Sphingobium sp. AntQ-1]